MISVGEALDCIRKSVLPLLPVRADLKTATGLTLSEDIFCAYDIPAYPQSNVDGYALAFQSDIDQYEIVGEIAAGSDQHVPLKPGKAVRIFTGAAVPDGADTVIMQEKVKVEGGILHIPKGSCTTGDHVRPVGSEMKKGQKALSQGEVLFPARIGFLAGIGVSLVHVFPRPRISIIVTGNEIVENGADLSYGQVYDSNSWTLRACLEQYKCLDITVLRSGDDPKQLMDVMSNALSTSDLILVTGGVSVGDYDFTGNVFDLLGITKLFHKVKQKPGKPLLYGMKGTTVVFGLPGNPASVLTCFYEYVLPALGILMRQDLSMKITRARLTLDHEKPIGLTHFLKGVLRDQEVTLQKGQESYKLSSFATANCLIVLPEQETQFAKGDLVEVHLIP